MVITQVKKEKRGADFVEGLLAVWESSVRATHDFLKEGDVEYLRPFVEQGLQEVPLLFCLEESGMPVGFLGMEGDSIEMLFVAAEARGRGIGSALMRQALALGASRVDVNEQNPQALGFYRRFGFEVESRDAIDSLGLPYPILHCALSKQD
ncbi:MAG: GNAT family N-acetyltransferase [Mailhella sp.]|nr:GNAT family N-acetyltransferase [Mailhella sp.]